ncbi:MAG: PilZ domain-containing protein [Terriglobales bacterium]
MAIAALVPASQEFSSVKVAVVNVPELTVEIFRDCFKDVHVAIDPFVVEDARRINDQALDALLINFASPDAAKVLTAVRNSGSNRRCVIYGIGTSQDASRFWRFGINVLLEAPTALQILAAVRATYLLLVHRLRRHVRIPLVAPVTTVVGKQRLRGMTRDISSGGLNIAAAGEMGVGHHVTVSFQLPQTEAFRLEGVICWKSKGSFGVALFNSHKQTRLRKWTDDYLMISEPMPASSTL